MEYNPKSFNKNIYNRLLAEVTQKATGKKLTISLEKLILILVLPEVYCQLYIVNLKTHPIAVEMSR